MPGWFDPENARLYGEAHRELMAMYERLTGRGVDPDGTDPAITMLPVVEAVEDLTDPASRPDGSWCEDRDPDADLSDSDGRE